MKKKTIANVVMIAIIIVIALSGVFFVGRVKGWFDKPNEDSAVLTDFNGIVTMERDGVAYTVDKDTVLRNKDKITCDTGATVKINVSDGYIVLGENAKATVTNAVSNDFEIEVNNGEAFVDTASRVVLNFDGKENEIKNAVATLSVRSGAQSISVYSGQVGEAKSGQMLEWINGQLSLREFSINSLNEFNIDRLYDVDTSKELVFSRQDLKKLEEERSGNQEETKEEIKEDKEETKTANQTSISKTTNKTTSKTTSKATSKTTGKTTKKATSDKLTCTITIRCDTILKNKGDLEAGKAPYVPKDGCILPTTTVEFTKGETVFDVLKRVCNKKGIQIEYNWTPMYNSYYIEGINNLYEFDCGKESGWMYKVNGWFPNYGCSSYTLKGGETIVWCYTCKGLGTDVGAKGF